MSLNALLLHFQLLLFLFHIADSDFVCFSLQKCSLIIIPPPTTTLVVLCTSFIYISLTFGAAEHLVQIGFLTKNLVSNACLITLAEMVRGTKVCAELKIITSLCCFSLRRSQNVYKWKLVNLSYFIKKGRR